MLQKQAFQDDVEGVLMNASAHFAGTYSVNARSWKSFLDSRGLEQTHTDRHWQDKC